LPQKVITGEEAEAFPPPKATITTTGTIWVKKQATFTKVTAIDRMYHLISTQTKHSLLYFVAHF